MQASDQTHCMWPLMVIFYVIVLQANKCSSHPSASLSLTSGKIAIASNNRVNVVGADADNKDDPIFAKFTKTERLCPGTYWYCPFGCHSFSLVECLTACRNYNGSTTASNNNSNIKVSDDDYYEAADEQSSVDEDHSENDNPGVLIVHDPAIISHRLRHHRSRLTMTAIANKNKCTAVRYNKQRPNFERCALYFGDPWCFSQVTVDSAVRYLFYVNNDYYHNSHIITEPRLVTTATTTFATTTTSMTTTPKPSSTPSGVRVQNSRNKKVVNSHQERVHYAVPLFFHLLNASMSSNKGGNKVMSAKQKEAKIVSTQVVSSAAPPPQHLKSTTTSTEATSTVAFIRHDLITNETWLADQYFVFNGTCYGQYWRCTYCFADAVDAHNKQLFANHIGCMAECLREPRCGGFRFRPKLYHRCEMLLTMPKAVCLSGVVDASLSTAALPSTTTSPEWLIPPVEMTAIQRTRANNNKNNHQRYNDAVMMSPSPSSRQPIYLRKSTDVGHLVIL